MLACNYGLVFRCSFTVLTSDGALHHIEISQEPSASISSSTNTGLALKRQFPQNIFCFDYYPELSLLAVVGSDGGSSITASGKSGMLLYFISFDLNENLYFEFKQPLCSYVA